MEYGVLWLGALLVFIDLAYPVVVVILLGKETFNSLLLFLCLLLDFIV